MNYKLNVKKKRVCSLQNEFQYSFALTTNDVIIL